MKEILYTAAHGGFPLDRVPLGGGGAICEHLADAWRQQKPFPFRIIDPSILGVHAPGEKDLVRMSEWAYARFCRAFERASTDTILSHDPGKSVVLCNDVSEGPDFRLLAQRGFPVYTIYHVDVVDYFTRIYLRGWIRPESATRFHRWMEHSPLRKLFTDIFGLVLQKQQDSVLYSRGLIVPSDEMRNVLTRCYPVNPEKIHVIPWGIWEEAIDPEAVALERTRFREMHRIPEGAAVILTLSRISPEKAQDRLLKAMALWERRSDFPAQGVFLFIAGEEAYMQGKRFQKRLERLAGQLRRTHVIFPGYASGARKRALFSLADLYVFPSRHESYGLTMLEAMRSGLPILAAYNHGAREAFQPGTGEMLPAAEEREIPGLMMESLRRLLANRPQLRLMGKAAEKYALTQRFEESASTLADIIRS